MTQYLYDNNYQAALSLSEEDNASDNGSTGTNKQTQRFNLEDSTLNCQGRMFQ